MDRSRKESIALYAPRPHLTLLTGQHALLAGESVAAMFDHC